MTLLNSILFHCVIVEATCFYKNSISKRSFEIETIERVIKIDTKYFGYSYVRQNGYNRKYS